jgi:FkbM family methyltransferase
MKEAFVLAGPIAAGKSYVGKFIERKFGIPFLEYENIFIQEFRNNPNGYLKRAEPKAESAIFEFLEKNGRMCFENTMNRKYALDILKKLRKTADVRAVRVNAPFDLTLKRFRERKQGTHVEWSDEEVRRIYDACENLDLGYDLVLDNNDMPESEMTRQLNALMEERKWSEDHVEIGFRGQKLKFNSWSGENLTPYDMEYKPWAESFRKENPGYLRNYSLKQGDVVIDAGAYEGTFAVYAAKAVGENGRVVAFEPDTENCRKLQENIRLNLLTNVTVISKALWSEDRTLKFNNKHTAGSSFFFNASPHSKETAAVSLDSELKRLGIDKADFIKMDVEGAEVQALKGSEEKLKNNDANLAIGTYHVVNGEETCAAVEAVLKELGYEAETGFPEHKTTYGSKARAR